MYLLIFHFTILHFWTSKLLNFKLFKNQKIVNFQLLYTSLLSSLFYLGNDGQLGRGALLVDDYNPALMIQNLANISLLWGFRIFHPFIFLKPLGWQSIQLTVTQCLNAILFSISLIVLPSGVYRSALIISLKTKCSTFELSWFLTVHWIALPATLQRSAAEIINYWEKHRREELFTFLSDFTV